jgi:hypothetical protein
MVDGNGHDGSVLDGHGCEGIHSGEDEEFCSSELNLLNFREAADFIPQEVA